jgi:hypothetical protein
MIDVGETTWGRWREKIDHNLLMIGPASTGKTILAKRLPTILSPLTSSESLETTRKRSTRDVQRRAVPRHTPTIPAPPAASSGFVSTWKREAPGVPIASGPGCESAECASAGCGVRPAVLEPRLRIVTGLVDREPLRRERNPFSRKLLACSDIRRYLGFGCTRLPARSCILRLGVSGNRWTAGTTACRVSSDRSVSALRTQTPSTPGAATCRVLSDCPWWEQRSATRRQLQTTSYGP